MKHTPLKVAIAAICFVNLLYMIPSVAVSGMVAAFPDQPQNTVLLLLTLPNLTGIAGIVAEPWLEKRFSRRQLAIASLTVFFATGLVSFLLRENLPALIAASVIMGAAYGMQATLYPLLVNDGFEGEERSRVMGMVTGMLQLGRVAATLLGGLMARHGWYHVYLCFLAVLVPLVLSILFLPKQSHDAAGPQEGGDWFSLAGAVRLAVEGFAFAALFYMVNTHLSLYVEGYGLGDTALTGVISALGCVLAGLISTGFAWFERRTGRFTMTWSFGILGALYLAGSIWISLPGAVLCVAGAFLGMGLFSPNLMLGFSRCAGPRRLAAVTAAVLTVVNVGYFASPYITGFLAGFVGESPADVFRVAGVLGIVCALASAFDSRKPRSPLQAAEGAEG